LTKKRGTFKQRKKNTFYQQPLEKCVEMMRSIDTINGKKPEKLCILMTDGFPMDCGGKKDMFSEITQPLVSGTTRAEDCQTKAASEGVKIQTIFIQTGSSLSVFNAQSLDILARISHCTGYKELEPASSGLSKEVVGTYDDGSDCPYMRAAISGSSAAYRWLEKQADALVDAVLEEVIQLCPVNYHVKNAQCVKCPPNHSNPRTDDRCQADTECIARNAKPCEKVEVEHNPVAVVYVVDFSNSVKEMSGPELKTQFDVMRHVRDGFKSVYEKDGANAKDMMMTSMVSFSNDWQSHVFENQASRSEPGFTDSLSIIDDVWNEKGSNKWTPSFGTTNYEGAVQECYRLLKHKIPADFLAKNPVKLCVLITDGAPQDCGGTKKMQPVSARPFVLPSSNKQQCADTTNAEPSKLLTLYLSLDGNLSGSLAKQKMRLMSELSSCGGHIGTPRGNRKFLSDFQGRTGSDSGPDCNYFYATKKYDNVKHFVPRFIETVTKVKSADTCKINFKVRNHHCVACSAGRTTSEEHDRCGPNTTCIGDPAVSDEVDPEAPSTTPAPAAATTTTTTQAPIIENLSVSEEALTETVENFGEDVKHTEVTKEISAAENTDLIEDLGTVNSKEQLVSVLQSSAGKPILEKLGFTNIDELVPALKRLQGNGPAAKDGEKDLSKKGLALLLNAAKLPAGKDDVKSSIDTLVTSLEAVPANVRSGEEVIEPEEEASTTTSEEDDLDAKSSTNLLQVFFSLAITTVGSMYLL
jgi:hypothetical protein